MTDPVCAVTPDLQFFVIVKVDTVLFSDVGHRAVERRIEDEYVGYVAHHLSARVYAHKTCRHVKRRKFDYFAYAFARIVRNECAFGEVFPACAHAVSDCGYFIRAFYDAVFGIGQYFENFFDRDLVIREIFIDRYFFFSGMLEKRVAYAYSVGYALGKDLFRFHFKQTVFE